MVKDSRKYASTGGWGYAHFNDGKPADEAVLKTCFPCHQAMSPGEHCVGALAEIVALEHCCSSGFANTDLDLQLKKHGIHQLIVIGLRANTCVESTIRFAAELGYEVTMVKDARLITSTSSRPADTKVSTDTFVQ